MKRTVHRFVPGLLPRALVLFVLACHLPVLHARAATPDEVSDLAWCPTTTNCLNWLASPAATQYELYRGGLAGLPDLLTGALDSCFVGSFTAPTTGQILDHEPLAGACDWYLVTARNGEGEGSAGQGSAGPRLLDSSGACVAGADLVLNEIDYDQPGTDQGEFIEVYNGGPTARELSGLVVILVNGGDSAEYRRYALDEAGASLPAGAHLVIGSPSVVAALPPGSMSIAFGSSSNSIQNGAPDGVALFDTTTGVLLDALSYEGSITAAQFADQAGTHNLVEGNVATAQDSNADDGSLSRSPSGSDTDDAETDWRFVVVPTPGATNPAP